MHISKYFSYNVYEDEWFQEDTTLQTDRYLAAAINIQNGSWWITGGIKVVQNSPSPLKSTELSYRNSTTGALEFTAGVELPRFMTGHCITRVNKTHIFLGGGNQKIPYLFDETTSKFIELPSLRHQRSRPACAVVKYNDGNVSYKSVIMVVGGHYTNFDILAATTTEFIDPANITKWQEGPKISEPFGWSDGGYINFVNDTGLLLVSGVDQNEKELNTIYHYNEEDREFKPLRESLKKGRENPGVVSIPMGEIECNKTNVQLL